EGDALLASSARNLIPFVHPRQLPHVAEANGNIDLVARRAPCQQCLLHVRVRGSPITLATDDAPPEASHSAGQHPGLTCLPQEWQCLCVQLLCRKIFTLPPGQASQEGLRHSTHLW